MGRPGSFGEEILVIGILSSDKEKEAACLLALEKEYGIPESLTAGEAFLWTDYYVPEMGQPIWRRYLQFKDFVDPARLAGIKTRTNELEAGFSEAGMRKINLDPGLLAPGRFVLATTKDRAHRIALAEGIYAELTLIYEKGEFRSLPWTYPDWASEPVRTMLAGWRKRLFIPRS